jgi:hypothetical protein
VRNRAVMIPRSPQEPTLSEIGSGLIRCPACARESVAGTLICACGQNLAPSVIEQGAQHELQPPPRQPRRRLLIAALVVIAIASTATQPAVWTELAGLVTSTTRAIQARLGRRTGTYSGIYVAGYERSEFRPCGSPERWWLESRVRVPVPFGRGASSFVVAHGVRSARGRHGHLGVYDREFLVDQLISASPAIPSECRDVPWHGHAR